MLLKWAVPAPALCGGGSRCVHVYLPEGYDEEPDARFPVLYMFDGQNVFLDEEASFGRSWRMLDYMQFTRTPLIIVAPESCREGNGRLEEYSPFTHREDGIGLIPGAMLGGIVVGIIEALVTAYISSSLANAVVFLILIVMLLVKPAGILGKNAGEKV